MLSKCSIKCYKNVHKNEKNMYNSYIMHLTVQKR